MDVNSLGTAANLNVGTSANQVVQMTAAAKLPAVDGSLLTGLAGGFAAGTVMIFKQTAAPTGWTKDVTAALNDSALRVITGTVGAQAGTAAFSTTFASRTPAGTITVDNTTLTTAQIPSHTHTQLAQGASIFKTPATDRPGLGPLTNGGDQASALEITAATGGGGAHNHTGSFTGTAMDFAVKYNDVIVGTKD